MRAFHLEGREYIELTDLLKLTGLVESGGMAKAAIAEGLVTVDGQVELRRRSKLRPGAIVEYAGRSVTIR